MSVWGPEGEPDDLVQCLPGMGPAVGDQWRNRYTGEVCVVLAITQRRASWAKIRSRDRTTELKVSTLVTDWEPLAPAAPGGDSLLARPAAASSHYDREL